VEEEEDATARLIGELEGRWEDPYVDFKRQIGLRSASDKAEYVKDMLGLANTQGRSRRFLMIGWDDESKSVVTAALSSRITQDRLQQVLNRYADPPPHISYTTHLWRGSVVGLIEITREPIRLPYKVSRRIGKRNEGEVFVRHGTITEPPTPRELQALHDEGLNARLKESADDLIRPDRRSLAFTPIGLSLQGVMSPKTAAQFQDHTVDVQLNDAVPEDTRRLFERLQSIHRLGIWSYDMYTVADGFALQVLEHAFAVRLIVYYDHQIPVIDRKHRKRKIEARGIRELVDGMGSKSWRLVSRVAPAAMLPFTCTLAGLFNWARHEALLPGQRSRRFDFLLPRILGRMRPLDYALHMPVDSSLAIRQVGEFINQLWGSSTTDGEIFPAPMKRREFVLGWTPERDQMVRLLPDQLAESKVRSHWRYVVVLGVDRAESLDDFHSDFERTPYPAELLHAEASWAETLDWLSYRKRTTDSIEILDRYFVINLADTSPPRNLGQFAALAGLERRGRWLLLQADSPIDAFVHAKIHRQGPPRHKLLGQCNVCWVDGKVVGSWQRVIAAATNIGLVVEPISAARIEVPMSITWSR
jgi:hypothetical protein